MGEEGGRVTEEDKAWGLSDLEKQGLQVAPGLLGRVEGVGKVWGSRVIAQWNFGEGSGGSPWFCQGSGGHGSP